MQPHWWALLPTWLLVIGTLAAVWVKDRRSLKNKSISVVMEVHRDRYESARFRKMRSDIAKLLLVSRNIDLYDDDVLVFFEQLGYYVKKNVLDKYTVWNELGWETIMYWSALTKPPNGHDQIKKIRTNVHDRTLYENFQWLYDEILKIECNRRRVHLNTVIPSSADIKEFLTHEVKIY